LAKLILLQKIPCEFFANILEFNLMTRLPSQFFGKSAKFSKKSANQAFDAKKVSKSLILREKNFQKSQHTWEPCLMFIQSNQMHKNIYLFRQVNTQIKQNKFRV
jgi:hypothetical protein